MCSPLLVSSSLWKAIPCSYFTQSYIVWIAYSPSSRVTRVKLVISYLFLIVGWETGIKVLPSASFSTIICSGPFCWICGSSSFQVLTCSFSKLYTVFKTFDSMSGINSNLMWLNICFYKLFFLKSYSYSYFLKSQNACIGSLNLLVFSSSSFEKSNLLSSIKAPSSNFLRSLYKMAFLKRFYSGAVFIF